MSASIVVTSKIYGSRILLLDPEDVPLFENFKWHLKPGNSTFYLCRTDRTCGKKTKSFHREIFDLKDPKLFVDHINHNGLDNRRSNLRLCTAKENSSNRRPNKNSYSQYRGVTWLPKRSRWQAYIKSNGVFKYIGQFESEHMAAAMYNLYSLKLNGHYAYLNRVPAEYVTVFQNYLDLAERRGWAITEVVKVVEHEF